MGLTFGVALSLVVMAGAELFTGNNLAMGILCNFLVCLAVRCSWQFRTTSPAYGIEERR